MIGGGEIFDAEQRAVMRHAAREKIGEHYDGTGLTPMRGGDAKSGVTDCRKKKERGDDNAAEKRDPEMERKSDGFGDFPDDECGDGE